jgi:hypothetical protein
MAKRLSLTTFLALILSLAVASGGYSAFSASGSDSGTVSAGDLKIRLGILADHGGELVFINCSAGNMAPGDECSAGIHVRNQGTVDLQYDAFPNNGSEPCFNVSLVGPVKQTGSVNPTPGVLLAGSPEDRDLITVKVSVQDDNDCQGKTAEVGLMVEAVSLPHP